MENYMILNTVPIYSEAPVSLELLKGNGAKILSSIKEINADKNYIIANENSKEIQAINEELKAFPNLNVSIVLVKDKSGFVYGNASALAKLIEGEKPIPSGIKDGIPVYSVEGLLNIDKKTVFIGGKAKTKGVFTIDKKIKPRDILKQCESEKEFKGMYFGHPMGLFLDENKLDEELEITTDYIFIYDESDCMLQSILSVAERYLKESCGRCVFGYEGTTQNTMILKDISQKRGKSSDIGLLYDLGDQMKNHSLCEVGKILASTVISALDNFKEEIESHITRKVCKAVVCDKFVTYHILPDMCTGCTDCQDVCLDDAILGKKKYIHIIDQDECTQCGECMKVCKYEAIVKAGAIKPKGIKKPVPVKR